MSDLESQMASPFHKMNLTIWNDDTPSVTNQHSSINLSDSHLRHPPIECVLTEWCVLSIDADGNRETGILIMATIFSMAFNCAFQGLLDFQFVLYNPFLQDKLSLPHESASQALKALAEGMQHQSEGQLDYDGNWSGVKSLRGSEIQVNCDLNPVAIM